MSSKNLVLVSSFLLAAGCGNGGGGADAAVIPPGPGQGPFAAGVAYLADADIDETYELYVADLEGDGALKVSGPLVAGGDVHSFAWSPDRSHLAFLADKDTDEAVELYVVGASGGGVAKVSGPLPTFGSVTAFEWSPDSSRLAYYDGDLLVAQADGSGSVRITGLPAPYSVFGQSGGVPGFHWAPDGSRVAYAAVLDVSSQFELFTSLPDGSQNVKVSGPMVADGGLFVPSLPFYAWAPDSSAIAYLADQEVDNRVDLYRSLPDGTGNLRLSVVTGIQPTLTGFQWAPDASRLAYVRFGRLSGPALPSSSDIHVVGPSGSGDLLVASAPSLTSLSWAPDASLIAYAQNFEPTLAVHTVRPDGTDDLFWVQPLRGGLSIAFDSLAEELAWAPSSHDFAVRTKETGASGTQKVWTTTPDSGAQAVSPMPPTRVVTGFAWAPDASRVAYSADQDTQGLQELYVSHPGTTYGNIRVSLPLLFGHGVASFEWTADSSRLVYAADVASVGEFGLFALNLADGTTIALTPVPVFGGAVVQFALR